MVLSSSCTYEYPSRSLWTSVKQLTNNATWSLQSLPVRANNTNLRTRCLLPASYSPLLVLLTSYDLLRSSNTVSFHPSKTTIVASIYQVTSLTNAWTTPEYGASRSVVQRQLIRLISFSGTSRSSLEAESLAARATDAYDYTAGDLSPYAGMLNCSPFARRLAI